MPPNVEYFFKESIKCDLCLYKLLIDMKELNKPSLKNELVCCLLSAQCLMDIVDGRFTGGYSVPVEMLPDLGTLYNVTLDMEDLHHLIENNQKVSEQQVFKHHPA